MKPRAHLRWKTLLFCVIVILSNALGNLSLTWGMRHQARALRPSVVFFIEAIFSPFVLLGITLLIVWLLTRMALLSWADLSYVLPVTSLGYVLSTFFGRFFLAEYVSPQRWAGTLLIVAGTALVGLTAPGTTGLKVFEEKR